MPARPSKTPEGKPARARRAWAAATSQPRMPERHARAPRAGRPRHPSARRVAGPATPSTRSRPAAGRRARRPSSRGPRARPRSRRTRPARAGDLQRRDVGARCPRRRGKRAAGGQGRSHNHNPPQAPAVPTRMSHPFRRSPGPGAILLPRQAVQELAQRRRPEGRERRPGVLRNAVSATTSPSATRAEAATAVVRTRRIDPHAGGVALARRRSQHGLEQGARGRDGRRTDRRRGERIEGVAGDERIVQRRERLDVADVVEHHEAPADRGEHPDLAALHVDLAPTRVRRSRRCSNTSCSAPVSEATPWPPGLRRHLVPHLLLVGARRRARRRATSRTRSFLRRRSCGWAACGRGSERLVVAPMVPAALLDAADRHRRARSPGRTSTETSKVRFCWAPRTSSPS